jgi:predicted nuclease of restriction endonuclease-like (RecB) superfamily
MQNDKQNQSLHTCRTVLETRLPIEQGPKTHTLLQLPERYHHPSLLEKILQLDAEKTIRDMNQFCLEIPKNFKVLIKNNY